MVAQFESHYIFLITNPQRRFREHHHHKKHMFLALFMPRNLCGKQLIGF